ncbi:helix-turn-helix transcriptional regulator [Allokutzneria oryzae]|uniref:DNA-binding response regulator n=1 Tax=Allokutzneria oryzae TaxID=1378989 RepID=A0ABV6A362_9PSEU
MVHEVRVRLLRFSPVAELGLATLLAAIPGFHVVSERQDRGDAGAAHVDVVSSAAAEPSTLIRLATRARVLVVSESADRTVVERYFLAGVTGCVHSSSPLRTFVEAVRSVARGQRYLAMGMVAPPLTPVGHEELSRRETEVLSHIADGKTHDQIARSMGISRHTVDTYVKRVRKKLSLGNKAELTRAALSTQLAGRTQLTAPRQVSAAVPT